MWMNKQNLVYSYNGILSSNKNETAIGKMQQQEGISK
jgi:hypothetical protein